MRHLIFLLFITPAALYFLIAGVFLIFLSITFTITATLYYIFDYLLTQSDNFARKAWKK